MSYVLKINQQNSGHHLIFDSLTFYLYYSLKIDLIDVFPYAFMMLCHIINSNHLFIYEIYYLIIKKKTFPVQSNLKSWVYFCLHVDIIGEEGCEWDLAPSEL